MAHTHTQPAERISFFDLKFVSWGTYLASYCQYSRFRNQRIRHGGEDEKESRVDLELWGKKDRILPYLIGSPAGNDTTSI